MKVQFVLACLGAVSVLAAPKLEIRQNDTPKCKDGKEGPNDGFRTSNDCKANCYLRETADGDNKNGVCVGACRNVGHPAPIFQCFGKAAK